MRLFSVPVPYRAVDSLRFSQAASAAKNRVFAERDQRFLHAFERGAEERKLFAEEATHQFLESRATLELVPRFQQTEDELEGENVRRRESPGDTCRN